MNIFYLLRVIRIVILILTCGFLHLSAAVNAQKITISAQDMALEKVFQVIKAQTGYTVSGPSSIMRRAKPVTIDAEQMPLEEFLNEVFRGQPLRFAVLQKSIVLSPRVDSGPGADRHPASQQQGEISGQVTDSRGRALPGASISLHRRGAETGTQALTDQDGHFTIRAAPGDSLQVSYLGYRIHRQIVTPDAVFIRVVLEEMLSAIDEVGVVSTGYQTLSRERVAGSFGVMTESDLDKRSNYAILSYLEGQVPGVLMDANGSITIRGRSTISADRDPLIVLDGFPIERSVSTINPEDIESITVLKDASAASIWGVRAANGVIVIQTKRGRSSRQSLDVSFSSTLSIRPIVDLNQLPFAGTASFIEVEKHRVDHGMAYFLGVPRPSISPVVDAYLNDPDGAEALVQSLQGINAYDEFSELFMCPETRQHYALGLAGKSTKSTYRTSFAYDRLATQFKGSGNERFVGDLFSVSELLPSLRLDMGLNAVYRNQANNGLSFSDLRNLLPYQRILDADGNYIPQPNTIYWADKEGYVAAGYPYDWDYNLKREFDNQNNHTRSTDLNASVGLSYQILEGFGAQVAYQYELSQADVTNLSNEETYAVRNAVNLSTTDIGGTLVSGIPAGSMYRESFSRLYSHTLRGSLRFDRDFHDADHQITALAGMDIREVGSRRSDYMKYGYDPQTLQFARVDYTNRYTDIRGNQQLIPDNTVFDDNLNRFVSFYGNGGYTFLGRYTFNASTRLDKTNLFGSGDQYRDVWLWSTGVNWQIHRETFMEAGLFDRLVLRASYGINGNVDRSTSPHLIAEIDTDRQTNHPFAYVANPQNPLLRWERTAVTNLAIDFSLFNHRLQGSLERYHRVSDDLLGNATVNGTYGFDNAFINYASMKNSGWDLRLAGRVLDRNVKWTTTLNYSYNKNEVTAVDFPQETVGAYLNGVPQVGKPMGYLYSYRWAGLDEQGAPRVFDAENEPVGYVTEMADPLALIYMGTDVAPHFGAWINEFRYDRFSVLVNFTYKLGHKFRQPVIQYEHLLAGASQVYRDWDRRWMQAGDELVTDIPAAPTSISGLNVFDRYTQYADLRTLDASHIRFRELLVNYSLPARWFTRTGQSEITIGFQARNLGTYRFNPAKLDPEYLVHESNAFNRNNLSMAPRPEYSLMIKANF